MVLLITMCYPEQFRYTNRPILANSWEAYYMKVSSGKLLKFARNAKKLGIELIVIDDGWFKGRNNDTSSLGDWIIDKKKFPNFKSFSQKINNMGLKLGIWVEPEMISVKSELYTKHPEWAVDIPGREHSEGRNQRLLDLCNPEVVDYVIETLSSLFSSYNIEYVKWDMNRNVSDYFSKYLNNSSEFNHRYIIGLYKIMSVLTKRFPYILFEGCASGGNRFDLGILSYFPQIWASDNTDAICRISIQENYSYGYPSNCYTGHVSSVPNHQTLRVTPLSTRFNVAAFSNMGYEINLNELHKDEIKDITKQVEIYKKYRDVFQYGDFYKLDQKDNEIGWLMVSSDKTKAIGMLLNKQILPNHLHSYFKTKGLNPDYNYRFYSLPEAYDINRFGDLVNAISPVHISRDSIIKKIVSKFYKMPSEIDDYIVDGKTLNNAGVNLNEYFAGAGFNAGTRVFGDYDSRMYFIEKVD